MKRKNILGILALTLAVFGASGSAGIAGESSMEEQCRREVVELHAFFVGWFTGELGNDEAAFARFAGVMAEDFQIIGPEGHITPLDAVLGAIRSAHGQRKPFDIEVRNVKSRTVGEGMVIVTYEEHQTRGDEKVAWQSTAFFRAKPGNPNGVEWLHVQETYLPK